MRSAARGVCFFPVWQRSSEDRAASLHPDLSRSQTVRLVLTIDVSANLKHVSSPVMAFCRISPFCQPRRTPHLPIDFCQVAPLIRTARTQYGLKRIACAGGKGHKQVSGAVAVGRSGPQGSWPMCVLSFIFAWKTQVLRKNTAFRSFQAGLHCPNIYRSRYWKLLCLFSSLLHCHSLAPCCPD